MRSHSNFLLVAWFDTFIHSQRNMFLLSTQLFLYKKATIDLKQSNKPQPHVNSE